MLCTASGMYALATSLFEELAEVLIGDQGEPHLNYTTVVSSQAFADSAVAGIV
jgi:hypothetical protein